MCKACDGKAVIARADEGDPFWYDGGLMTMKARPSQTGGSISVVDVRVPQAKATPLHMHPDAEETIFVIEGEDRAPRRRNESSFRVRHDVDHHPGNTARVRRTIPRGADARGLHSRRRRRVLHRSWRTGRTPRVPTARRARFRPLPGRCRQDRARHARAAPIRHAELLTAGLTGRTATTRAGDQADHLPPPEP